MCKKTPSNGVIEKNQDDKEYQLKDGQIDCGEFPQVRFSDPHFNHILTISALFVETGIIWNNDDR